MTTLGVVGVATTVVLTLTFTLGIGGGIYLHKKRVAGREAAQQQEVLERALDGAHSHTSEVLRVEVEKREHVQALEKMGASDGEIGDWLNQPLPSGVGDWLREYTSPSPSNGAASGQ